MYGSRYYGSDYSPGPRAICKLAPFFGISDLGKTPIFSSRKPRWVGEAGKLRVHYSKPVAASAELLEMELWQGLDVSWNSIIPLLYDPHPKIRSRLGLIWAQFGDGGWYRRGTLDAYEYLTELRVHPQQMQSGAWPLM